jgi:hypothetical protein
LRRFFGLRWRGKDLADWEVTDILPAKMRSALAGGTQIGEAALTAWELGQTLPEFEERPIEQQYWAIAARRIKIKAAAVDLAAMEARK